MPYTCRLLVAIGLSTFLAIAGCARKGPGASGEPGTPASPSATKSPRSSPTPAPSRPRGHLVVTLSTGMGDERELVVGDSEGQLGRTLIAPIEGADLVLQMTDSLGSLHVLREDEGVWRLTPDGAIKACSFKTASVVPPPAAKPQPAKPAVTVTPKGPALIVHTTDAGVSTDLGFRVEHGC